MSDHFITKTSLAQADLVTVDGHAVLQSDSALRDAIANSDAPELGTFFATPVLGAVAADGAQSVSWYAAVAGKPKSLDLLDGAAREDVSDRLAQRMSEIETLKGQRPDLAETLSGAQSVLSRGDILVIAGQPVAINWGARPDQVDPASHYNATIGAFLSGGGDVATPVATPKPAPRAAIPAAAPVAATTSDPSHPADKPRSLWGVIIPLALLATILLGVLIWLAWPGTRLFPPEIPTLATEMDTRTTDTLRDHNNDLRARADALQDALDNGQCTDDGLFVLPDGRTPEGLLPPNPDQPQDDARAPDVSPAPLLPPNPDRVQTPQDRAGNIVDLIERNSVLVVTDNGIGTGFFIAPDVVFTNHHVIEEAIGSGRVLVMNDTLGQPTQAEIIRHDGPFEQTGGDFALLRVAVQSDSYFSLLDGSVDVKGQGVIAAGYPGDIVMADVRFEALMNGTGTELPDMVVTNGIVNTEQQIAADVSLLIHSASISQGNSGGPLVDLCGRVLGMNTFVSQQAYRNLNLAQTGAALSAFLARGAGGAANIETSPCAPNVAPVSPAPAADPSE